MNQLATRLGTLGLTLAAAVVFTANLFLGLEQAQAAPIRPLAPSEVHQFAISIGDVVSNGIPASGAGNIEEPDAVDIYTFNALAGQEIIFNWLSGNNVQIGWQLQAPNSTVLFDTVLQDQKIIMPQTGIYTLIVDGNGIDDLGLYSFQLLEAPDPQQFTINFDDIVSNDVPSFMACLPLGLAILKCLAQ